MPVVVLEGQRNRDGHRPVEAGVAVEELLQQEVHVVHPRERVVRVVEAPEVRRPVGPALEPEPLHKHGVGVLHVVDEG